MDEVSAGCGIRNQDLQCGASIRRRGGVSQTCVITPSARLRQRRHWALIVPLPIEKSHEQVDDTGQRFGALLQLEESYEIQMLEVYWCQLIEKLGQGVGETDLSVVMPVVLFRV